MEKMNRATKLFKEKNIFSVIIGVVVFIVFLTFLFCITIGGGDRDTSDLNESKMAQENTTSQKTATEMITTTEPTTTEIITTTEPETTTVQAETTTPKPTMPYVEVNGDYSHIGYITPTDGVVTMAFVGDINLSEKIENYYNNSGLDGFLSKNLQNIFLNSDIFGINHEYVSSDAGDEHKVDYEIWYYKNTTRRQYILNEMGVDVVTLANNHTMDYGVEGLIDTMNSLKARNIAYVGVGNNLEEAKSAYIQEVNGKKIAILAANRVVPRVDWYAYENKPGQMTTYESTDRFGMIKEEITRLKTIEKCDVVVVMVHFGENKQPIVQDYQKNVARGYVDAGADIIVGCHTHTLQGAEIYNDKYIFYGVSNFLFENYLIDSAVVQASLDENNKLTVKLVPCVSQNYQTHDVCGNEAKRIFKEIEALSTNIVIDDDGVVKLKN